MAKIVTTLSVNLKVSIDTDHPAMSSSVAERISHDRVKDNLSLLAELGAIDSFEIKNVDSVSV